MSGSSADTRVIDGNTVDIAGLMARLRVNESQISASQTDLNNALAAARGAAGGAAGGANLEAQGQMMVNEVVQRAAIKEQTDNASEAARLGVTPGAPSQLVIDTINNFNENQADLLARGKMISSKQNESFFDNPLQWLTNQFALPYDIAAYNLKVSEQDRNLAYLRGLSQTFDDQARVNKSVDAATGQSLLDGLNKIALGKAQREAASSGMQLAQLGISVANMRVAMTDKAFDNYARASSIVGQEQARALEQRRLTLAESADKRAQEELALRQEEQFARSQERARLEAGRTAIQDRLNKASALFNITPPTVDEYLMDPNIQKAMKPFMTNSSVQSGYFGRNPAEALANTQGFPLTPGNESTRQWLDRQINTLVTSQAQTWKSLGPEVQEERKEAALREAAQRERNNIPIASSPTSIYSAPPLKSVLTMAGLLSEDKKSYRFSLLNDIAPLVAADPTTNTDPNLFIAAAAKRVAAGTATTDQMAIEISGIYRAIGWDNSLLRGYDRFSLPMLMADNGGFKQQISIPGFLSSSTVIDLMNTSAVRNILDRLVVQQRYISGADPTAIETQAISGRRKP